MCFSNEEPDLHKLSRDRYNVIHLGVDLALDREKVVEEFDFDIDAQDESDNGGPA